MICPLPSLKISWTQAPSELRFTWESADFPKDARFVSVYSVNAAGNRDKIIKLYDITQSRERNNMSFSLPWPPVLAELQVPRFFVYASTYPNELDKVDADTAQQMKETPAYYASVVTGFCRISWYAKNKKAGSLKLVKLSLDSGLRIPAGFLGYRVTGDDAADIKYPFPFAISNGGAETPAICVRADQSMEPVIMRPELAANIRLQKESRPLRSILRPF